MDYQNDLNIPTEQDEMNNAQQRNQANTLNETNITEETIIINEGLEDDFILSNSQNIKLNEEKAKEIVNSEKEEITPIIKIVDHPEENTKKKHYKINSNNIISKLHKKKSSMKQRIISEELKEKNKNDENTDDLFKKAIENTSNIFPPIELDNDLSVKVTEVLYDKYVEKNPQKSKHLDIYSKFKDEAILQKRELNRTKDDYKKISDMIERQEKYEEIKHDKKIVRQRELKNKIKKECVFIPNGKKNIGENMRTYLQYYTDQKKFVKKKEGIINKLVKDKIDGEEKLKKLISKNSEKIANNKNPNETLEIFCKRLAEEKLKTPKENIESKKEEKKMTKKEISNLTEKLHKEGETFKINREKKKKELIDKIKNDKNKYNFVLEKSTKVLFEKFLNEYDKVINDLFGNDKINTENKNYEIDLKEYKMLLNNLSFIKSTEEDIENNNIIEKSFNYYLNPKEGKIDTNKFLAFCLAALGIYKGNDEKVIEHSSKITPKLKPIEEEEEENENEKEDKINTNNQKKQIKTSTEFIKLYLPDLDLDKYGFTEKECNIIKRQFFVFVLAISESWSKDLVKKKQERLDKLEETIKKNNEENKKIENKKKEEEIIGAFRQKIFNEEIQNEKENNNNKTLSKKSFKFEDMCDILQKKKKRELETLISKKEEEINKECTFQPNYNINKLINKKEVEKKIEKLYIEGKKSYIKKRLTENESELKEIEKNCTFKPTIKDYKGNYFENNPLKEDKLFNTEIKKMEKLREEQGYTNKKIKKQMVFNIEPKSNKDNINKRVAQKRGEKIVNNIKNEFIDYGTFDDKGNQIMMKIEINLENNKKEVLTIQPGEDYMKIVDEFCFKHKINDDKKSRLIRAIKERIRKNEN